MFSYKQAYDALFNTATAGLAALSFGFQAIKTVTQVTCSALSYLWTASGLEEAAAPITKPVEAALFEMYEQTSVITKVALGKVDPSKLYSQTQIDEMAKEKTPTEISIITILMVVQITLTLAVIPFYFVSQLFVARKLEAAW